MKEFRFGKVLDTRSRGVVNPCSAEGKGLEGVVHST